MSYEIIPEGLRYDGKNVMPFLKWNYVDSKKVNEFKNKEEIKSTKSYSVSFDGNTKSNVNIETLSGIIEESKFQNYVNSLMPYSFILQVKIKLKSPYFSSDDDNFYLVQNPCLKEKVFKVPMIRGSGGKGAIARVFKEIINEENNFKLEKIKSFMRIFGTGSNEFRELKKDIENNIKKNTGLNQEKLITYVLFELGLKLKKDDIEKIKKAPENWIKENLWESFERGSKKKLPSYLTTHKGRAIFYPTYFNKFSLEIINPHDRRKRTGTNPIHYEVVPKGTEGILQIVYIPFDGVLTDENKLKDEVKKDIEFLTKAIEKFQDMGIGAKTKLGWGRFELRDKKAICNKNEITIPEGWKNE